MELGMEGQLLFIGPMIHSKSRRKIEIIENGAILIENGMIKAIETSGDLSNIEKLMSPNCKKIELKKNQFLCPGFIDTHIHAPQYPNIGLGYDRPLLEWLQKYTFPLEMKYSNNDFAKKVYTSAVKKTLSCGTTTACYYATIHTESALTLGKIIAQEGQRAIVGKVNMNQNSMGDYVEKTEQSLSETEKFLNGIFEMKNELIEPAVTPRFAISCDMNLMKKLGDMARKYNSYVQTHISENLNEIQFVKELYPDMTSYTNVYEEAGLLTNKTILGHGIFLSEHEMSILSSKGTSIAHCPNSNTMLQSGLCDVKSLWESNVKVGLGTDVSGGSSASILEAMRSAMTVSIHISFNKTQYKAITFHEAFFLATLGGASAIGKEDKIGNFQVGKDFDALLVEMAESDSGLLSYHNLEELFQKFIFTGDDRNIKQVYVKGRLVKNIQ